MFQVGVYGFEDLTEEQQENVPNNGVGKEDANYIRMVIDDDTWILSDAVEPEDATFNRDFSEASNMMEIAYLAGKAHATEITNKQQALIIGALDEFLMENLETTEQLTKSERDVIEAYYREVFDTTSVVDVRDNLIELTRELYDELEVE